ncbi:MAG: histidinol-phosphate transaminase [Clostridia bacterium]|nr:histidinol-phosphate transaminase [Clostridia bacterium]
MSRFMSERLQALKAYVPGEQPRRDGIIKLNTNESPFPPAPGVAGAVAQAAQDLRLYSDLSAKRLIGLLAKTYGVTESQVIVGNGSDELLAFAFQAFGGGGLAFPDITYGFYPVWAALYGLDAKIIPLSPDFSVRPEDYMGIGRCAVLANPNAPTGRAIPPAALAEIAVSNPDRVLIVDEAYADFGEECALGLLEGHDNILIVRTFSKSRQLAGGRLGFAIGSEALIDDLNRVRYSFNPYNVNALTQAAGAAALEDPAYFNACLRAVIETRAWTASKLEELGFVVTPSQTNFLFAAAPGLTGGEYQRRLREKNIFIRYFDLPRIGNYVRITIGTQAQMERLIEATKELLS